MASGGFDSLTDRQLNDVALPAELLPRLCDIAALSDDELDVRLRDVSLPDGLIARLAGLTADEDLDELLRELPIPVSVLARTRIIPDRRTRSPLLRWALAASLVLMVGASTFTLVGSMVSSVRPVKPPELALVVIDQGPLDLVSPIESAVAFVPETPAAADRLAGAGFSEETMAMLTTFDRPKLGPAGQLAVDLHTAWNPWDNWLLKRWGALGYAPTSGTRLPELTAISAPVAQGREAPLVRGYDREFLYAYGVQPPTFTALDADARSLDVPLVTQTDSFDQALRLAAAGRVPMREQIRVEHFLAAVQPRQLVEASPGSLVIGTAAGPSVFNPSGAGLLQIGVQAGMPRHRSLAATHLVLAIDASARMAWNGELDLVRRAVADLLRYLGPDDRLSMLVLADESAEIIREVRGDDHAALDQARLVLEQVTAGGSANLAAAVQQVVSVAMESESSARLPRRCVLITASPPLATAKDADVVGQLLVQAAREDFGFEVCDLAREDDASGAWQALTEPLRGVVRRPRTADALCWALVEALTGDSSLAATEVRMHVEFNPKAVVAYRLIGHEATALGGLLPASLETDLHVGQGASALLEVWLYPNEEDDVGSVGVQWIDPADGKSRQAVPQRISRVQFAASFEGSALSLQAAAIAAEGAEVLKQGFNFGLPAPNRYRYDPKPGGVKHVLFQAERASAVLAQQPRYQRLVELLGALSGLAGERGTASARSGTRGIAADLWREYGTK